MTENKLPKIHIDKAPKILLLGNGVNKAFAKDSWNDVIEKLSYKNLSQIVK